MFNGSKQGRRESLILAITSKVTLQQGVCRARSMAGKIKGETELELAQIRRENPSFHAMTARPNAVDPHQHPEILPYVASDNPIMGRKFGLAVRLVAKYMGWMHSPTQPLGKVLTELTMGRLDGKIEQEIGKKKGGVERLEGGFVVLENTVLRQLAGLN
ncbi:hypothetical protein V8F33_011904 [Rhypophila sp. PSN 637]